METNQDQKEEIFITKDTIIGEAVEKYPEIVPALQETGINCVGCQVAGFETLEQGLSGHGGYGEKKVDEIIDMLNKLVRLERAKD